MPAPWPWRQPKAQRPPPGTERDIPTEQRRRVFGRVLRVGVRRVGGRGGLAGLSRVGVAITMLSMWFFLLW